MSAGVPVQSEVQKILAGLKTAARWARSQYHAEMIRAAMNYIEAQAKK